MQTKRRRTAGNKPQSTLASMPWASTSQHRRALRSMQIQRGMPCSGLAGAASADEQHARAEANTGFPRTACPDARGTTAATPQQPLSA
eukprot:4172820-Pleurochrysis_carterae.AAC.1